VTLTAADVVALFAASRARAASAWTPFAAVSDILIERTREEVTIDGGEFGWTFSR